MSEVCQHDVHQGFVKDKHRFPWSEPQEPVSVAKSGTRLPKNSSEIRAVVPIDHVDQTFGTWKGFRQSADYEPEQVCLTKHWKQNVRRLRERATEVSEKIHEILAK